MLHKDIKIDGLCVARTGFIVVLGAVDALSVPLPQAASEKTLPVEPKYTTIVMPN